MLWEIGEFEFLLQALKFGIWDVNLVRGDRCWHYVCCVLLLYVDFWKSGKELEEGERLEKDKGQSEFYRKNWGNGDENHG